MSLIVFFTVFTKTPRNTFDRDHRDLRFEDGVSEEDAREFTLTHHGKMKVKVGPLGEPMITSDSFSEIVVCQPSAEPHNISKEMVFNLLHK